MKELFRNCWCLNRTGSTNLQWSIKALYALIMQVSKQFELNTVATSLMMRSEHADRVPLPVAHK